MHKLYRIAFLANILLLQTISSLSGPPQNPLLYKSQTLLPNTKVHAVKVNGLDHISLQAIVSRIPKLVGQEINAKTIHNITKNLMELGCFSHVSISYEYDNDDKDTVTLNINCKEKHRVAGISLNGNNNLSTETVEKKLQLSKVQFADEKDILVIIAKLKKFYSEKQYNKVDISYELVKGDNNTVEIAITVDEGKASYIRKIMFCGNNEVSKHKLKAALASKEYWLLGFFDRGGVYRKEMIDFDKYQIENYYQNNGYMQAHVRSVDIQEYGDGAVDVIYNISEGDTFRFGNIGLPSSKIFDHDALRPFLKVECGELYSRDGIRQTMEILRKEASRIGYLNANVSPKINVDHDKKRVGIDFIFEEGNPVHVRKINIKGNTKTLESVIRRELLINEGDVLTMQLMEDSKRAVESLGFFTPQTGVNWAKHHFDAYQCDLDMLVQEGKTGRFFFKVGLNSGNDAGKKWQTSSGPMPWYSTWLTNSNVGISIQNSNWMGQGIKYFLDLTYSNVDRSLSCGLATNWLFEWPINAGWNFTARNTKYEDFRLSRVTPKERTIGSNIQLGFRTHILDMALIGLNLGFDDISYQDPIVPIVQFPEDPRKQLAFQQIATRSFQEGTNTWATLSVSNDKRNHPVRPTSGYQWIADAKISIPNHFRTEKEGVGQFGYARLGLDARWYTPLIMNYNVVLHMHIYAGLVHRFEGANVPYKELYHVGGPQSVRGFLFGQIGPTLMGSSLGGTRAFFLNTEIQAPISKDGSIMGVLFYDGGSAWDTIFDSSLTIPGTDITVSSENLINNNKINYRHSVGFGLRLTVPAPVRIDWGFKLDRNRKAGESLYEVHISMEQSY